MSARWDRFHSEFLDTLNDHYGGIFYGKLLEGLETFKKQRDLNQMIFAMFPLDSFEVEEPTPEAMAQFDKGNVGNDTTVLMYINKKIADILQLLLENGPSQQTQVNIRQLNDLFIDTIKNNNFSKTAESYLKFLNYLSDYVNNENKHNFRIESKEDLALAGIICLIDAVFRKEGRSSLDIRFIALSEKRSPNVNTLNIDDEILYVAKMSEQDIEGPITRFLFVNSNYEFGENRGKIQQFLPAILSSSSFLWKKPLLELSPANIEAMSEEQRILTLVRNKSEILSACFEELFEGYRDKVEPATMIDLKNKLTGAGNRLQKALSLRGDRLQEIAKLNAKAREIKKAFIDLAELKGSSQKRSAIQLFNLLKSRKLPAMEMQSEEEGIIYKALQSYQTALFQKQIRVEEIKDLSGEINEAKNLLEKRFKDLIDTYTFLDNRYSVRNKKVLNVYATFSFILLNKDLFPSMPLKGEAKKKGAQRILRIAEKLQQNTFFDRWKKGRNERSPIFQEIVNAQLKRMYASYEPKRPNYHVRELTEDEIGRITAVSQTIESEADSGNREAIKKFVRLEKVLEEILVDHAGMYGLMQNTQQVDRKSLIKAQSHLETALLFTQSRDSLPLTGVSNSAGFARIFNQLLKSLDKDGVIDSALEINDQFVKNVQVFAPIDKESITELIQHNVNRRAYNELLKKSVQLVPRKPPSAIQKRLNDLQKMGDMIKDYFLGQIEQNGSWIYKTYTEFEKIFEKLPDDSPTKELERTIRDYIFSNVLSMFYNEFPTNEDSYMRHQLAYGYQDITPRDLILNFRKFFQDNGIKISSLVKNRQKGWRSTDITQDYSILVLPWIWNKLREIQQNIANEMIHYAIMPNENPLILASQADVFSDKTLFRAMDNTLGFSEEESNRLVRSYQDFLPIFVGSYVFADNSKIFDFAVENLNKKRLQLIDQLPSSRLIYEEIKSYLDANQLAFQSIQQHIQNEMTDALQSRRITDDPETWGAFFQRVLNLRSIRNGITDRLTSVGNEVIKQVLFSIVAFGGIIGSLKKANLLQSVNNTIPFSYLLLGMNALVLGERYLGTFSGPALNFASKTWNTLFKAIKAFTGSGEYSKEGPSKNLLQTMTDGVYSELATMSGIKDHHHRLVRGLHLKDLMTVLEESQYNLLAFSRKISSLIPHDTKQTLASVQALNMFYMLNKDLFTILPSEMLENCGTQEKGVDDIYYEGPLTHFEKAAFYYLQTFEQKIQQVGKGFQGSQEDKKLPLDHKTPYWEFLAQQEIVLDFDYNSPVGKFFGRPISFKIKSSQLIDLSTPPNLLIKNLRTFRQALKEALKHKELISFKLAQVLNNFRATARPLSSDHLEQVKRSMLSFFELVRYGVGLARKFMAVESGDASDNFANWISATGEKATTILSGDLFQTAMSELKTFGSIASHMNVPEGQELIRGLKRLDETIEKTLNNPSTKNVYWPSFDTFNAIKRSIADLLDFRIMEFPMIAYPLLNSLTNNKNITMAIVHWENFKATASPEAISLLNNSREVYLANSELELFNDPHGRGFMLSPFVFNAFNGIIRNTMDEKVLRLLAQTDQSINTIPRRFNIPGMIPQYHSPLALPPIQSGNQEIAPLRASSQNAPQIPQGASWLQPPQRNQINPDYDLAPYEYDPQNLGINPVQAYTGQGGTLPQGVQNKLQEGIQNQYMQPSENQSLMPPGASSPQRQIAGGNQQGMNPLIPLALMGAEPPINKETALTPLEQPMQENPSQEIMPQQRVAEQPIMVGVDAQGRSLSISGGAQDQEPADGNYWTPERMNERIGKTIDKGNQRLMESYQEQDLPVANEPLVNPEMQNYNPGVDNSPFPWRTATIGAGALLGAALLGGAAYKKTRGKK